jgi:hypothetical protein
MFDLGLFGSLSSVTETTSLNIQAPQGEAKRLQECGLERSVNAGEHMETVETPKN